MGAMFWPVCNGLALQHTRMHICTCRWTYFARVFLGLQFLVHMAYMGFFIAYAFTIRATPLSDGRR